MNSIELCSLNFVVEKVSNDADSLKNVELHCRDRWLKLSKKNRREFPTNRIHLYFYSNLFVDQSFRVENRCFYANHQAPMIQRLKTFLTTLTVREIVLEFLNFRQCRSTELLVKWRELQEIWSKLFLHRFFLELTTSLQVQPVRYLKTKEDEEKQTTSMNSNLDETFRCANVDERLDLVHHLRLYSLSILFLKTRTTTCDLQVNWKSNL